MNRSIQPIPIHKPASPSILQQIDETFSRIRDRAYELFTRRGSGDGGELDDWVKAERDLFLVPPADLKETENQYEMDLAAAGYKPEEIQVAVEPDSVIVQGKMQRKTERKEEGIVYSEMSSKELFRRVRLAQPIDPDSVKANLEDGVLHVVLPKANGRQTAA